ncbi:hypothetical protein [Kurthia sp. Dielmo]|uniref:hypothetical protein n=1 Tax=Kurthia sp. Dielmo TaxID=1033738 RepID=UPI0021024A2C|nr:hypothetical protein [Kurthia sp. Dielmo]
MSFSDPSLKEVIGDIDKPDYKAREKVDGIHVGVAFMNDEDKVVQTLPAKKGNTISPFKQYTWANWEQPNSIYRLKPSYYMVQDAFMKNEQAFVK